MKSSRMTIYDHAHLQLELDTELDAGLTAMDSLTILQVLSAGFILQQLEVAAQCDLIAQHVSKAVALNCCAEFPMMTTDQCRIFKWRYEKQSGMSLLKYLQSSCSKKANTCHLLEPRKMRSF